MNESKPIFKIVYLLVCTFRVWFELPLALSILPCVLCQGSATALANSLITVHYAIKNSIRLQRNFTNACTFTVQLQQVPFKLASIATIIFLHNILKRWRKSENRFGTRSSRSRTRNCCQDVELKNKGKHFKIKRSVSVAFKCF